jgi:hypothetical protein
MTLSTREGAPLQAPFGQGDLDVDALPRHRRDQA